MIFAKRILKLPNLHMLIKQESITFSQNCGSRDFWRIANSVLNKSKSAILPLFNGLEVLSSASDKAKVFAKNFSNNSNLDDLRIYLPVFPCRTNLKQNNISVTRKIVKKVLTNLDCSKASDHDCIPVPVGIYLLKVNNRNSRARCKMCLKLTINTSERRHWRRSGVFIVNFEYISHLVLVFLLLTLNRQMPTGVVVLKKVFLAEYFKASPILTLQYVTEGVLFFRLLEG